MPALALPVRRGISFPRRMTAGSAAAEILASVLAAASITSLAPILDDQAGCPHSEANELRRDSVCVSMATAMAPSSKCELVLPIVSAKRKGHESPLAEHSRVDVGARGAAVRGGEEGKV